ncbi:KICSTOR complex protein kaptin-like [Ptychodera flava]|uniref:KICSTOR complex protein kaptin-like n=1 Tax=Ptychodera flava TaxID=63121 RepID=UPI00396AA521
MSSEESEIDLSEAHFYNLPSQSNVYGLTSITFPDGSNKILVASLRGKIVCVEYQNERGVFRPSVKEVHFTYIPGDAEIISIDAFSRSGSGTGLVVGITFIKDAGNNPTQFLNIYSPWEAGSEYNLDSIAQGCFNLELDFIPYHLYHTEVFCDGSWETVFLLSGGDSQVHVYKEDKFYVMSKFEEIPCEDFFPEFKDLQSNVLWMDIKNVHGEERLTAMGCENGYFKVCVVNPKTVEVLRFISGQHDGAVTSIRVFFTEDTIDMPCIEGLPSNLPGSDRADAKETDYHLLVSHAAEPTIVYRNCIQNGLHQKYILEDSEKFHGIICTCLADVDWDGSQEILLGAYGQKLLVYKFIKSIKHDEESIATNANEGQTDCEGASPMMEDDGEYKMVWERTFAHPVLAMQYLDLTNDGLSELSLVSTKGLHILQHDLDKARDRCAQRLKQLIQIRDDERT